jgi:hypothetical protein
MSRNRLLGRLKAPENKRSWTGGVVRRITPLAEIYSIFIVGEAEEVRSGGSLARTHTHFPKEKVVFSNYKRLSMLFPRGEKRRENVVFGFSNRRSPK